MESEWQYGGAWGKTEQTGARSGELKIADALDDIGNGSVTELAWAKSRAMACKIGGESCERLDRSTAVRTSPEDHSVPLHDVVGTRSTIDTLGRVRLHALEVAHKPAPCWSRHAQEEG